MSRFGRGMHHSRVEEEKEGEEEEEKGEEKTRP
jgi:hypothetical protein